MSKFDFCGWATRNDLKCTDGRIIRRNAFKHNDGKMIPLVWNHRHNEPWNVLGHAMLENRDDGVYAYAQFNESEGAKAAKEAVKHGDITGLSIYANRLKQSGSDVLHGEIIEMSLVYGSANPGAYIEDVMIHSEDADGEAVIYMGTPLEFEMSHADDEESNSEEENGKTLKEVFDEFTPEQKAAVAYIVGEAMQHSSYEDEEDEENQNEDSEGGNEMKHNAFDKPGQQTNTRTLSYADGAAIIELAKKNGVGSLQHAMELYCEQHGASDTLKHGIDDIDQLFPDYKDVRPGAPELVERDQSWVGNVMKKVHKSPISRIRTRQMDVRADDLRAHGYNDREIKKILSGNMKLMKRTTDPQTVYRRDALHRDDIIDITEFDVVEYQYGVMRANLNEEIALAILVGDGREDGDESKIQQEHIRSIWLDEDDYTIHYDVDIEAARAELQGSNTSANFGENYIYSEAIINAALYSREKYKGSGSLEFYCTPHLLNVMLLARDLNGRRIYSSKADLAAALNVSAIHTVEQFVGKTRKNKDGETKKLLGLFVNLADYQVGCTKGGEITKFQQFDIDFNQEKYLIETRISGALTKLWSAIALEEPVAAGE